MHACVSSILLQRCISGRCSQQNTTSQNRDRDNYCNQFVGDFASQMIKLSTRFVETLLFGTNEH
eukprot:m.1640880 g.1640880  ORF g.1640880 m.1640880 type:complete len:64 (+) comp44237_c0_seq1:97-288(+)